MRILASFYFSNGKIECEDIVDYRPFDDIKKAYSYVQYDNCIFEWVTYDIGVSNYDYKASFAEIRYGPGRSIPTINKTGSDIDFFAVCECGKDKHGFAKHSHWCKKFTN